MRTKILKKIEQNKENLRKVENAIKEDHWNSDPYFNGILNRNLKMEKFKIRFRKGEVNVINKTEDLTIKAINKTRELFNKFKNWVNKK